MLELIMLQADKSIWSGSNGAGTYCRMCFRSNRCGCGVFLGFVVLLESGAMTERKISWWNDSSGRIAGIEDQGNGWAVVDATGEIVYAVGGYSAGSRQMIEAVFEEYVERMGKERKR